MFYQGISSYVTDTLLVSEVTYKVTCSTDILTNEDMKYDEISLKSLWLNVFIQNLDTSSFTPFPQFFLDPGMSGGATPTPHRVRLYSMEMEASKIGQVRMKT